MRLITVIALALATSFQLFAQKKAPDNWFNLDLKQDKVWGVSTERAYKELPIGKNKEKIIVAVIDAGTDVSHEDLKNILWVNEKEVAGNGLDDDKNGYVDDVFGWNFIGGPTGNVAEDTYEYVRVMAAYKGLGLKEGELPTFKNDDEREMYLTARDLYDKNFSEINGQYQQFKTIVSMIEKMIERTGTKTPTMAQMDAVKVTEKQEKGIWMIAKYIVKTGGLEKSPVMLQFSETEKQLKTMVEYNLNMDFDSRHLVGDNYANVNERFYGNNQVEANNTDHGTHVAGIIAAERSNNTGIKGICGEARIMTLRVVPNGDERDKDIANAIRYAVDHGAKVINMSFGKKLSPNKQAVDEAVTYALNKDVLMVHAAGNDAENLTTNRFYPSPKLVGSSTTVPNWIEVGASGWQKGKKGRVATFSNYGKAEVEVFAPGVAINSTVPGSEYKSFDGTSMAAPVVAGVAALVRQNYPNLTAAQTKQIILKSAVPCKEKILIPGTKTKAQLSDISVTGAIVNAYEALLLADKVSKGEVVLN
jgi:subtilisin family serine protease